MMIEYGNINICNGKVIGEFVCDEIETLRRNTVFNAPALYSQSCLTRDEYFGYIGNKTAYIWHISDLVIYDKPKELFEFGIKKAPQSWCYVEECGYSFENEGYKHFFNYCPNCGAKMDGDPNADKT